MQPLELCSEQVGCRDTEKDTETSGLTKTGGVICNSCPFAYLESLLTLYFEVDLDFGE